MTNELETIQGYKRLSQKNKTGESGREREKREKRRKRTVKAGRSGGTYLQYSGVEVSHFNLSSGEAPAADLWELNASFVYRASFMAVRTTH